MNSPLVLLVEDDPLVRLVVERLLLEFGYAVQSAAGGEEALRLLAAGPYDLLITDLLLGTMHGLDLIAQARLIDPELEAIVLTGRASLETAIAAVRLRACAYLLKPVTGDELREQVHTALERRQMRLERVALLEQVSITLQQIAEPRYPRYGASAAERQLLRIRELEIDLARRQLRVGGQQVPLSSNQFDLLVYLARNADAVQSPELLAREVLGYTCAPEEARELIKASIHRLRSKIELDPKTPSYLVSVRGAGYMLSTHP